MRHSMIDLWKSSALVQGLMALICLGVISYLAIAGREIPAVLVSAFSAILGFYFGKKVALD